jgi:hypothetical protein
MMPGENQSLVLGQGKALVVNDAAALDLQKRGILLYCVGCSAYHLETGVTMEHVEKEIEASRPVA